MRSRVNLSEGEKMLEILVAEDFQVVQFSEYHFRIEGRLDIWPSTRKWYDKKTMRKGSYGNLIPFIRKFFNGIK